MIRIDNHNLASVLSKRGVKMCGGLENRKCFRPRREKGRLCAECHRDYMHGYMAKKRDGGRARVSDGYDFSQENYV